MKAQKNSRSDGQPQLFPESPADTKAKILEAAFRKLATSGYANLAMRDIAKEAGVNHALINYHFGTKDQLVIDVLDAANERLLARQRGMYGGAGGFAEKWAEARRFYEDDLASGFVRVQAELLAASFSNPELRQKVVPRIEAWKEIVLGGVREALASLEASGVKLPPPFTAEAIACWVGDFWLGMEFVNLLGSGPEEGEHREALDAMKFLLEHVDTLAHARSNGRPGASRSKAKTRST
jgi:AcrR family transcriptional regulator